MIDREMIAVFHYDEGSRRLGAEPYRYAEEVIRCKECKRVDTMECPIYEVGLICRDDDYCSKGERAEQTERGE